MEIFASICPIKGLITKSKSEKKKLKIINLKNIKKIEIY